MTGDIELLGSILRQALFRKYVHILLTDRGSEFSAAVAMKHSSDGTTRTRVYYFDPMQYGQKGTLENKTYRTALHSSERNRSDSFEIKRPAQFKPDPQPSELCPGRTAGWKEPAGTCGFYVSRSLRKTACVRHPPD